MTTFDRNTGDTIDGWAEVRQSIAVILTTPLGTRVMRRDFGSELMDLIDRPITPSVILAAYAATVQALARWEPRFAVTGVELASTGTDGSLSLSVWGIYKGEQRQAAVALGDPIS